MPLGAADSGPGGDIGLFFVLHDEAFFMFPHSVVP